ncbi:MAG: DNA-formamidopyrimidine glycosylase family protein [Vulcanimicrobiota bacterium]
MPEGDTVHKVARVIGSDLVGQTLIQVSLQGVFADQKLVGRKVEKVEALGKHLLVEIEGGATLRVHLGMRGKWHRYRPDEPWKRKSNGAAVVLATSERTLVCFFASEVEVFATKRRRWHPQLSRLGPDLLGAEPDYRDIVVRARQLCTVDRLLGEVLLDQRVAAGIGNVYKSEVAFMGAGSGFGPSPRGVSPWRPLASLGDQQLADLYRRARSLLLVNLGGHRRMTREQGLWVYQREGETCLRCGNLIRSRHQGLENRATFWCDGCQDG